MWWVPLVVAGGQMLMNSRNKPQKPKMPATEKASSLISMANYNLARGINDAQMPYAMKHAKADHSQSLRNSANTQAMSALKTNPFMQGNAVSGKSNGSFIDLIASINEASNISRANKIDRSTNALGVLQGNSQLSNAGLTDLSSMASNAAIRRMENNINQRNAQSAALMSLAAGAGLGYMNYKDRKNAKS